jgi:group I intron endonuclease
MVKCGIYLIENTVSPLFYIGQTVNTRARWSAHRSVLNRGGNANRRLLRSWRKYGASAFVFSILEECATEKLTERETFWVEVYRINHPGLVANSRGPVDNPTRGVPMSAERRARMSEERKGRPNPLIAGDKNPAKRAEVREKLSGERNPAKRPEVRQRMSDNNASKRGVIDAATGETWETMSECASYLGVSVAAVHAAATKKNPTVRGRILDRWVNERLAGSTSRS